MRSLPVQTDVLNSITVEYRLAPNMVVFSHGFGVTRHSRGMFTDIVSQLPDNVGYILFDYYRYDGSTVYVTSVNDQMTKLNYIVGWARTHASEQLSLVAHSRGCMVAALAQPAGLDKIVMLAPPFGSSSSTRQYFTTKPGVRSEHGMWIVPRSDGTTSIIPNAVFDEMETRSSRATLLDYARKQPLDIITAAEDKVLHDQDYTELRQIPGVTLETIVGASHDFDGTARQMLIARVMSYLDGGVVYGAA